MLKFSPLILVLILGSIQAYAEQGGAGSSGGGNAMLCKNSSGKITLLDHYEGLITVGSPIDFGPVSTDHHVYVNYVLNRLRSMDPVASDRLQKLADNFESELQFVNAEQLKVIKDSHEVFNPVAGCDMVQFAVQLAQPKLFQKRYYIDKELWKDADTETRAGLLLHEIVYGPEIPTGDSTGARYYNYLISSQLFTSISIPQYYQVLADSKFINAYLQNYGFFADGVAYVFGLSKVYGVQTLQLSDGSKVEVSGSLRVNENLNIYEATAHCQPGEKGNGIPMKFRCLSQIGLYPGRKLRWFTPELTTSWPTKNGPITLEAQSVITLHENGSLERGLAAGDQTLNISGRPFKIVADRSRPLEFYPNGQISAAAIYPGVTLKDSSGKEVELETGFFVSYYDVTFNEQGELKTWIAR